MITKNIKVYEHNNAIKVVFNSGTDSQSTCYLFCAPTAEHIDQLLRDLPTCAAAGSITAGEAISILNGREQMDPTGTRLFSMGA